MLADADWWFADITNDNWCYQCLTNAGKCSPDGDQCLPDGSRGIQCCQPSKSCKNWWKNQKNRTNMSWQHCLRLKLLMNYPIPRLTSVISDTIGSIGYHRQASVSIVGIGGRPDILPATGSKVSIGYPRTSASHKRGRIESYRHRLRSVTECPRLRFNPWFNAQSFKAIFLLELQPLPLHVGTRGGRNVEFQNVDWPFFSLLRKCLFSSSLLQHHYIESVFLVHHYYDKNQTFDDLILPMASKKITTLKIKISTYYGVLPMVTKACGGLG